MSPKCAVNMECGNPGATRLEAVQLTPEEYIEALQEKDRASVIIMDAGLDLLLAGLIGTAFSRHDKEVTSLFDHGSGGPLTSLTRKATLAYALGLIDKFTLSDLKNLHIVRNRFAHLMKPDFNDPDIQKATKKLSTAMKQKVNPDKYLDFYRDAAQKAIQYLSNRYHERAPEGPIMRAGRRLMKGNCGVNS